MTSQIRRAPTRQHHASRGTTAKSAQCANGLSNCSLPKRKRSLLALLKELGPIEIAPRDQPDWTDARRSETQAQTSTSPAVIHLFDTNALSALMHQRAGFERLAGRIDSL